MIGVALAAALCALAAGPQLGTARAEELYRAGQWADTVSLWNNNSNPSPALDYWAGMALAHLGRFADAQRALEAGWRKNPRDSRFAVELAGLAYKRQDLSSAAGYLHRALALDRGDSYASDFLGTIYFLRHNLEAALVYWNRIEKPRIEQIRTEPEPEIRPALLDQAFAVAPASVLELRDLRATEASLQLLGIFPQYQFVLAPRQDDTFDLVFHSVERDGWGDNKWQALLSTLRGLPYATLYPGWYNLRHSAVNITSLVRFDPQKMRLAGEFAAPLAGNPNHRWRFFFDGRKESWNLTGTYHGTSPAPVDLSLEKIEAGWGVAGVRGDAWSWSTSAIAADRVFARAPAAGSYFTNGASLKYRGQIDRALVRLPEHRLAVTSSLFGEFGKLFARNLSPYLRSGATVEAQWFPQAEGDRWELSTVARAGGAGGSVPFDELFILGLERDNDLPLGAHIGTRDGRKGSAPMGKTYFLWNSELDRKIYDAGFLKIKVGPFLDSGKIVDPSGIFGTDRWLWDTGARLRISVLSAVTVAVSYGKDLRSGRNAFYAMAVP